MDMGSIAIRKHRLLNITQATIVCLSASRDQQRMPEHTAQTVIVIAMQAHLQRMDHNLQPAIKGPACVWRAPQHGTGHFGWLPLLLDKYSYTCAPVHCTGMHVLPG